MPAELTPLEQVVFDSVCELWPEYSNALRAQLDVGRVVSRYNTGGGFITTFKVPPGVALMPEGMPTSAEVLVDGLEHGMGFHIASDAGVLDHLEGHSYGEQTDHLDPSHLSFQLVR